MTRISQNIEFGVTQPLTAWRQDISLPEPLLRFPLDESRFCPQILLLNGLSAGLTLYWAAVTGASFYVVQLGDSASFTGPDVQGIKVTGTQLELNYIEHLRVKDQFFWRVAAHNSTGGFSVMSEVRSIKIACPETQGTSFNNEDKSLYADIASPQVCNTTGVNIELGGPGWVRKQDNNRTWVLNVNYDCDSFEGHQVSISDVVWEIKQSPSNPVSIDFDSNDHIRLDISAHKEEWFELIAHVIFNLSGIGKFECKAHKKILIEGEPIGYGGGGGGTQTIAFQLNAADCHTGQAVGTVLAVDCENSSVQIGDTVDLLDFLMCYLTGNEFLLFGRKGYANFMRDNSGYGYGCRWHITNLCGIDFGC